MNTRETILTELKKRGKARSDELSEMLKLTPMAVRQHFYQLQDEGAVECISVANGRGRPAKYWQLTPKADIYFQDAHRELSLDIISGVREILGDDALEKLVEHRTKKQETSYLAAMKDDKTVEDKLQTLAKVRSSEGYMADVITDNNEIFFVENHCPVCEAAKACSGICSQELSLFKRLMINDAKVERSEHIVAGARRCAYKITKKN